MALSVPVSYLQTPVFIANQGLDLIGASNMVLGDISDGSPIAEVVRRNYGQLLRQLLRTAHWSFARQYAKLELLGDATGQSAPPVSSVVECPWTYCYAWPLNCVQGRWMPWSPTNAQPLSSTGVPITTGVSVGVQYWQQPGRFLVSSSSEYPIEVGDVPWDQQPDLQRTEGVGPVYRKTILTDCCNAHFVYTRLEPVIEMWDDSFRQAMVTLLALAMIPTAITDPRLRETMRGEMIRIAKNTIDDARVANSNESTTSASVDHLPNWITARNGGWGGGMYGQGLTSGYTYYPWDSSMQWCGAVF